jgi:hypothetical protein
MAACKVDVQVLSVCPQTFLYAQPPALAAGFARIQNEQLAKLVKARAPSFKELLLAIPQGGEDFERPEIEFRKIDF